MSHAARFYIDRPAEFWTTMGPMFADARIKRELPYLADQGGFVWLVITDATAGHCTAFCCFEVEGIRCRLREFWESAGLQAGSMLFSTLTQYLRAVGVDQAHATVNGRAATALEQRGFRRVGAKGSYALLELAL